MAILDDLISQIPDLTLRTRLQRAVGELRRKQKFGLVYEEHLPETTNIFGLPRGRDQTGPWKIDARFNRVDLIARIEAIARLRRRISLSRHDATEFLTGAVRELPRKTLVYLDPPYYRKGKQLYYDYYDHSDHARVATLVKKALKKKPWIVSYDDTPEIRELYAPFTHVAYQVGYSARDVRRGSEIMFFSPGLRVPAMTGSMKER